eukprot:Hpha_TRINITY_DN344_c0_g1::TRINITY_DN344_c0_g1_i1::g.112586::m.112586
MGNCGGGSSGSQRQRAASPSAGSPNRAGSPDMSPEARAVYRTQYRPSQPKDATDGQRKLVERMNERAREREEKEREAAAAAEQGAPPPPEEEEIPERELCVICYDERRSIVFEPCNHCLCCSDCADVMTDEEYEKQGRKPQGCPACKQSIKGLRPLGGKFMQTFAALKSSRGREKDPLEDTQSRFDRVQACLTRVDVLEAAARSAFIVPLAEAETPETSHSPEPIESAAPTVDRSEGRASPGYRIGEV